MLAARLGSAGCAPEKLCRGLLGTVHALQELLARNCLTACGRRSSRNFSAGCFVSTELLPSRLILSGIALFAVCHFPVFLNCLFSVITYRRLKSPKM